MEKVICIIILLIPMAILIYTGYFVVRNVNRVGFTCGNIFISILLLFYIITPVFFLCFPEKRSSLALYNRLLSECSDIEICMSILLCSVLICIIFWVFKSHRQIRVKIGEKKLYSFDKRISYWNGVNEQCSKRIRTLADICFVLGGLSILLCMRAVGGLESYLALGSKTRGLDKNVTNYISGAYLPLITLSSIILVVPFLYKYLLECCKQNWVLRIKFISAFLVALVYLMYNQGRLPLLLYFIPFIFTSKAARKMKITGIILAVLGSIFLLEPLSGLFTYLSYGRTYNTTTSDMLSTFLMEFTYPFANFTNRNILLKHVGLRLGIDYIQWPFVVTPSSILKVIGFNKSRLVTVGSLNTSAYEAALGVGANGGIPADFFTFNYYQLGWITLLFAIILVGLFLKAVDKRIVYLHENSAVRILILRASFLIVSLVNNFDLAAIVKMRFDFVILIAVIFYISRKGAEMYESV